MAETTNIAWADSTFNPWFGCTKVSPACDNCYAEGWSKRSEMVQWGSGNPRRRSSESYWKKPLHWNRKTKAAFDEWDKFKEIHPGLTDDQLIAQGFVKPRRPRVFCASLADVFDNEVPPDWRTDLFALIEATPYLTWMLLTKRIGNVRSMVPLNWLASSLHSAHGENLHETGWPKHVWLGATICNQPEADRDIEKILKVPAAVRFLSIEPLLGPMNLKSIPRHEETGRGDPEDPDIWTYFDNPLIGFRATNCGGVTDKSRAIDWVIVGGESGPHARPMHPEWVCSLRDQCASAGVPFMMKQWGEWAPALAGLYYSPLVDGPNFQDRANGKDCFDFGDGFGAVRIGKQQTGRLLDGVLHDEYPTRNQ